MLIWESLILVALGAAVGWKLEMSDPTGLGIGEAADILGGDHLGDRSRQARHRCEDLRADVQRRPAGAVPATGVCMRNVSRVSAGAIIPQ